MDNWHYLPIAKIILIVNIWEDQGVNVNFYIVPEDKIANNRWHDDMIPYDEVSDDSLSNN